MRKYYSVGLCGLAVVGALMFGGMRATATELSFFQTYTNVDYTSAGVGGIREVGYGNINVTGITGGTVTEAYLYWFGLGTTFDFDTTRTNGTAYLTTPDGNSYPISGTLIGTSGNDSWGFSPYNFSFSQAFRADVTSLVTSNGSYFVSNFDPFALGVEGASLIVIYNDPASTNKHDIIIENGCDENSANNYDANGWNVSFPGINYSPGEMVNLEFHVGDGQCSYLEGGIYLNQQLLAPTGVIDQNYSSVCPAEPMGLALTNNTYGIFGQIFEGDAPYDPTSGYRNSFFQGSLWDIKSFNIVPFLSSGVNNLYITANYVDDDLTLVALVAKLKSGTASSGGTTNPPVVSNPGNANYSCVLPGATVTNITSVTVSDPNGLPLTVTWQVNGVTVQQNSVAQGISTNQTTLLLTNTYAMGSYTINVLVQNSVSSVTVNASVSVAGDTTPPSVLCGSNITLQVGPLGNVAVPNILGQATAIDNCTPSSLLKMSQSLSIGGLLAIGTYPVTISATDASGNTGTCTTTLTIVPAPLIYLAPIAVADSTNTTQGTPVAVSVLANDSDPNLPALPIAVSSFTQPANGTVAPGANGTLVYTPASGFTGTNTFTYTITNTANLSASTTVAVTVLASSSTGGSSSTNANSCADFTTYTQGGWGATANGNNPGALLASNFAKIYTCGGLTIGGCYSLTFTSASAIHAFLPQGGAPAALRKTQTNPTGAISVFAGEVLALQLNVDFSAKGITRAGLGNLHLAAGQLAGWSVSQVLSLCNQVLGGNTNALPAGLTVSGLNSIADSINLNYDNGTGDNAYILDPPAGASISGTVYMDRNANCDLTSDDPGISNVVVTLKNSKNVAIATNRTDANGKYSFINLTAGTYTVVVTPPAGYKQTAGTTCYHWRNSSGQECWVDNDNCTHFNFLCGTNANPATNSNNGWGTYNGWGNNNNNNCWNNSWNTGWNWNNWCSGWNGNSGCNWGSTWNNCLNGNCNSNWCGYWRTNWTSFCNNGSSGNSTVNSGQDCWLANDGCTHWKDGNGNDCWDDSNGNFHYQTCQYKSCYSYTNCNSQTVTLTSCGSDSDVNFAYTGCVTQAVFCVTGPSKCKYGSTITYSCNITNTGTACFTGGCWVNVCGSWLACPSLNPGQGCTVSTNCFVNYWNYGNLNCQATAYCYPPSGTPVQCQSSWTTQCTY